MEKQLITIASFSLAHQAHLLKSKLESEGIPCILADEYTITMAWFYSNALGGIKVQIPSEYYEEAIKIIDQDFSEELKNLNDFELGVTVDLEQEENEEYYDVDEIIECPFCHSLDTKIIDIIYPESFLSRITFGIIKPEPQKNIQCNICLHKWWY
ncbi:MAG TPA: hypothetical protein VKA34_15680 [Balneolales bacterium]|nr:hypothetical protein [Balneolales bacterium]